MIHIRYEEYDGVKYAIEYEPATKKFSTLLPGKRVRIEGRTEWDVKSDAQKDILKRKQAKKSRKPKPKITFFGAVREGDEPRIMTYEGVNLATGDVILKDAEGRDHGGRLYGPIILYPMTQQGRLAMAHAAWRAAEKAFKDLAKQHATKVRTASTTHYGDAADRSFRNSRAQDAITEALRKAL